MVINKNNQDNGNERPPHILEQLFALSEPTDDELGAYALNRLDLEERDRIMRMLVRSLSARKRLEEIRKSLAQKFVPAAPKPFVEPGAGIRLRHLPRFHTMKKLTAVAAVLVFCALAWGGAKAVKLYHEYLQEIATLRIEAERAQEQYDQAWAALRFEEVIKPIFRVLPGELNCVRVELSPRVEEGLVREVSVCWGDAGNIWEPIYEKEGTIKNFQAVHRYTLPPEGQTSSWTLRVSYTVPDAVAAARRLTHDQLTTSCRVETTTKGIRLVSVTDIDKPAPQIATSTQPEIIWLNPSAGTEVGWRTTVTLKSQTSTEKVTLLIRPHTGETFYVQPGGRPLSAGIPESFVVQLAGGSQHDVGLDFDILALCSDNFRPDQWSLDMSDIPHSSVVGRITVRKVAGTIHLATEGAVEEGQVCVKGEVWTPSGAALLLRQKQGFEVIETLPSSAIGGQFEKVFTVSDTERDAIYLLVYKEDVHILQVGQMISEIPANSYWLYGPAKKLNKE